MRTLVLVCALSLSLLAQPSPIPGSNTPIVTITKEGGLFLNEKPLNITELVAKIRRLGSADGVYVRADKGTTWEVIVQVLAELHGAQPPIPVKFAVRRQPPLALPK